MSDVVDKAELMERIDNDLDFLADTLDVYKVDCPKLISRMREALSRRDGGSLADAAHTLKGLFSNFSARPAVEASVKLQLTASRGEFSDAAQALSALETEYTRLKEALEAILQER